MGRGENAPVFILPLDMSNDAKIEIDFKEQRELPWHQEIFENHQIGQLDISQNISLQLDHVFLNDNGIFRVDRNVIERAIIKIPQLLFTN